MTRLAGGMYIDFLTLIVPALLIVTVVLQIQATRRIHGDISFEPDQRRAQLWLIWLVPVLGAALVLLALQEESPSTENLGGSTNKSQCDNSNLPPPDRTHG